jgi:hypothetical protein
MREMIKSVFMESITPKPITTSLNDRGEIPM